MDMLAREPTLEWTRRWKLRRSCVGFKGDELTYSKLYKRDAIGLITQAIIVISTKEDSV
jgi:hypothetical protein